MGNKAARFTEADREAFHQAITEGNKRAIKKWVHRGADIDSMGNSLLISIQNGHKSSIKTISRMTSNDACLKMALYLAADSGDPESMRVLVQHGADINSLFGDFKQTLIHFAALKGNEEMLRVLVELGGNINSVDINGDTALHTASATGSYSLVLTLINFGACIEAGAHIIDTPLHRAASQGNVSILKLLVDLGGNINAADGRSGNTPLHVAASYSQIPSVAALLEKNADINALNKAQETPLMNALRSSAENRLSMFRILVDHGADINTINAEGKTAMHIAAIHFDITVISALFELRADINCRDNNGNTPFHMSVKNLSSGELQCVFDSMGDSAFKIFSDLGMNVDTSQYSTESLKEMGKECTERFLRFLYSHGANPMSPDNKGVTPIYSAAVEGCTHCVQIIADLGGDINATDNRGFSPIHAAVVSLLDNNRHKYNAILETIQILIQMGADLKIANNTGTTPGKTAVRWHYFQDVVALASVGMNVHYCDRFGEWPLHKAVRNNDVRAATILIQNYFRWKVSINTMEVSLYMHICFK